MQTDYLVIGAGAAAMAFVDTLLDESDAHITIVDRHSKPGGHWNDAYSFVGLHQPSAYYGVNSTELGSRRKDDSGPNRGLYEMASGPEISTYYDKLMQQRFLPSGRVSYHPMSDYQGDGRIVSLLSGAQAHVTIRQKTVDATYFSPAVPSTHTPQFAADAGVRVVPPNALPQLWQQRAGEAAPRSFCVLGAGKTAMDAVVWLLRHGVPAAAIQWVMPRDSWIQNRLHAQPGVEFFQHSIGGESERMAAFANAASVDEVFLRLEASGLMLRIDPAHKPAMFHYATVSTGEIELLQTVQRVIRRGRVRRITADAMEMDGGRVAMEAGVLYVDCTASAISMRESEPVFQQGRIAIQLLRAPLVTLSAAMTAYAEMHGGDDARKNQLCAPVPFPRTADGYARCMMVSMMNQFQWSQDKAMRQWLRNSRLDGFAKMVSEVDKDDAPKQATLASLKSNSMAAFNNMPRLIAAGT